MRASEMPQERTATRHESHEAEEDRGGLDCRVVTTAEEGRNVFKGRNKGKGGGKAVSVRRSQVADEKERGKMAVFHKLVSPITKVQQTYAVDEKEDG